MARARCEAGSRLAALVRFHRRATGLTQEELAERSALSVRTVSDLERGVYRTARKDTARLIADALGLAGREREHLLAVAAGRAGSGMSGTVVPRFRAPPVPLFGRESLVATACSLLRSPQVRLLSLIGPGGVGKTRLAIEVVSQLTPEWPEPPTFIPLDGVQDADLVIRTVGRAIGVSGTGRSRARSRPCWTRSRTDVRCWFSTTSSTSST